MLACQEGLYSMDAVGWLVSYFVSQLIPKKLNEAQNRSVTIVSSVSIFLDPDFQKKHMERYELLSLVPP